jgi:hypothetical protein
MHALLVRRRSQVPAAQGALRKAAPARVASQWSLNKAVDKCALSAARHR